MNDRLIIDVPRLKKNGENFQGELPVEALDWGQDEYSSPVGGLGYDLFVQELGDELLVRGRVWQGFQCVCSRCAKTFEMTVEEPDLLFSLDLNECLIEINGINGFADLTNEVREAIILAFPGYPVCREDCKGLCPKCGKNLNDGPCGCRKEADNRWAALDGLG